MVAMRGSETPVAQALRKLAAVARTASCGVQHLAMDVIGLLRGFEAFDKAAGALGRAAENEDEQGDGERDEVDGRRPPCSWPGEDPGQQAAPYQRSPLRQSSRRAEIATAITPSASTMNSKRSGAVQECA